MSAYNGRPINVNPFIAGLNTIPTSEELAAQDAIPGPEDFDIFNNTNDEFFNFNEFTGLDLPQPDYNPAQEERARRQNASGFRQNGAKQDMFLENKPEFLESTGSYNHFAGYSVPFEPHATPGFAPQQPVPYHLQTQLNSPNIASPISPTESVVTVGTKRKIDSSADPNGAQVIEEASRLAAEEDKRRRNTAASARFRVKKKQREQALEQSQKEMLDKVTNLEKTINKLETENRWLKELLTTKKENDTDLTSSKPSKNPTVSRSIGDHTTGVGTDAKAVKA